MGTLKNLWKCKNNVVISWLFFFVLTLVGKTPYNIFLLFLISGAFSIGITLFYIIYVKSNWYLKN